GNAYFASCSGKITAIDPNGDTKWLMQLPGRISTGFTIGQNNTLYFSSDDALYAVDSNGRLKWTFKTDNAIAFPSIVDKQENIYIVTAKDNMLYAVKPEGSLNWKIHIDGDVAMQPSITAEGNIYVAVQDKSLYVLNHDGKFHWRRRIFSKPPEKPTPSPSTGNDVVLESPAETITKPVAESQVQLIPEALRISRKKPEIDETATQQPQESATTAFTSSTQKGYAPLRVEFLDTSTGEVIDRYWDFGDGTLVNSDRTPAHTYIIPGNYSIRFTTKRTDMVSTIVKKQYITVMDASMSNNRGEIESVALAENKAMPPVPTQISTVNGIPISKSGESESVVPAENKAMPSAPAQITTTSEGRKSIKYFPQRNPK
ncbi:MAG: PQQ-binding-like beta-propeller repeat protein, partial [Planctomycetota bacterium]